MDPVESGKRAAAYMAVDKYVVEPFLLIGVGSGSTVKYVVDRLAELNERFSPICVPTSYQSRWLLQATSLKISDLDSTPFLDVTFDGADEVDAHLNCIKGGGGCQTQEKIVASCTKTFIVVADFRKQSKVLGQSWKQGVPIEVVPMARVPVEHALKKMGGKPILRMAVKKAGPVVTDNGGFIIDCDFGLMDDPVKIEAQLRQLVGVVENGLFVQMAHEAYFGQADGTVIVLNKK